MRPNPRRWHRTLSLSTLVASVLLLCHFLYPSSGLFWLTVGNAPITAAAALPSSQSEELPIDSLTEPYREPEPRGSIREEKTSSEEADGTDIEIVGDSEPEHLSAEPADIWQDLEAAKEKLHQEHLNPREERLRKAATVAASTIKRDVRLHSPSGSPLLVVFTASRCQKSEEALREAQIAQPMVRNLGGNIEVATLATFKEPELAKRLEIQTVPCLRLYRDGDLESTDYLTYNGTDVTATEIAHWILTQEEATVRYVTQQFIRGAAAEGSPVGPVVHARVRRGSPRAEAVEQLLRARDQLPSRFSLFSVQYVEPSDEEEFRVYRQQLPFDVGEEEFLSLRAAEWKAEAIMALMLEAENRKVFYGDKPSSLLLGKRALLSVYVSQFENLQDIAWLLMEFQPRYADRIAFHIANRTLKMAARSADIFSHTWGGAVLTDQQANPSAYERVAGVSREAVPFAQYALSMPFNYHSMKAFFEDWASGKRELHFRSSRYSQTEKDSPVLELNHLQFLEILHKPQRAPVGVLYYEPGCSGCKEFLESWKTVATAFAANEALKGQMSFAQLNGKVNDLLDFDMRSKIPVVAVYPPGPSALDGRVFYTGPSTVELLGNFMATLTARNDEL